MRIATPLSILALLLLALLLPARAAEAQIVIERSDFQDIIGTELEATLYSAEEPANTAALQAIVEAEGPDQTYDFSTVNFDETINGMITYFDLPANVPGADDAFFSQADAGFELSFGTGETDSTLWSFFELRDDGVYAYGMIFPTEEDFDENGEPDTLTLKNDPPTLSTPLPLTYGTTWTTSFLGLESDMEIDGYGTLIGPDGSERPALRMHSVSDNFGITMETISFITKAGGGLGAVGASISVTQGTIGSASFTLVEPASDTPIEEHPAEVPERYRLEQNFPNPFNPQTTIRYTLSTAQHVTLTIYDVLGRPVETLVDARQPSGSYQVTFDADGLPSGVYFYRVEAGTFSQTRRMSLVQ